MTPLIPSLLAAAAATAGGNPLAGVEIAELTIRQRVVIRIQTAPAPPPARTVWREKGGPKCVPMAAILGAAVVAPSSVDIILRGGDRVRARFAASCPALDYYSGFYIAPSSDGRLCAGRDAVRDRAGGECEVDRIRKLVPKR